MFDYYELKFVFHGADCKRRAADMDEARAAKKELQAAGVKEITIFGVKKGTKEIQAAKKAYVKPEFKHEPAPKAAKTPKAAKVPATKKKAPKATKKQKDKISEMSADDLRAIDSIFSHDGKIKILKTNTPKREPAGQLDLFTPPPKNNNSFTLLFEHEELKTLNDALRMFKGVFSNELWYKNLIECVTNAAYRGKSININLNMLEIEAMIKALEEFSKIYEDPEAIKLKNQLVKIDK